MSHAKPDQTHKIPLNTDHIESIAQDLISIPLFEMLSMLSNFSLNLLINLPINGHNKNNVLEKAFSDVHKLSIPVPQAKGHQLIPHFSETLLIK